MLHFTLGCCAHHAHAAEEKVCSSDANDDDCHDHDGHGHDGHDHESPESGDPSPGDSDSGCPGSHCDDGDCVFMAAGKTVIAKAVFITVLPLCIAEPASFALISSLAAAVNDAGSLIALPVRTHLLNQVLLN